MPTALLDGKEVLDSPILIGVPTVHDDQRLAIGTDGDTVLVNRSTALAANTTLTGVLVGTVLVAATPANSLILSNITANADIILVATLAGAANSTEYLRLDSSVSSLVVNGGGANIDFLVKSLDGTNVLDVDANANANTGILTIGGTRVANRQVVFGLPAMSTASTANFFRTGWENGNAVTVTAALAGVLAMVSISEPNITLSTGTVATAVTLYIGGAPTEGTNNYALFVDAGTVRLDDALIFGVGTAVTATLYSLQQNTVTQLQTNVPAGAGFAWSVNGVNESVLTATSLSLESNTLTNIGNTGSSLTGTAWTLSAANSTSNSALLIENTTATGASHAILEAKVVAGSTGDAKVHLSAGSTTTWYLGIDNDQSDDFKIGTGSSVGSNYAFGCSTTGLNVRVNTNSNGTSAARCLILGQLGTVTMPTGSFTDLVHMASVDIGAGDARLAVQSELGSVVYIGNDRLRFAATTGGISIGATDIMTSTSSLMTLPIDVLASVGIRIGADSTNNEIDDASQGAASTTLYIGNASINVTSDMRLKRDIRDFQGPAMALLRQARVVDFGWDDPSDRNPYGKGARGRYVGMLGQEAIQWAPWIINAGDGRDCQACRMGRPCKAHMYWQVEYEHLVPLVVKGIQEVDSEVTHIKQQIQQLQSWLQHLEAVGRGDYASR
jgi:hypothetical protein